MIQRLVAQLVRGGSPGVFLGIIRNIGRGDDGKPTLRKGGIRRERKRGCVYRAREGKFVFQEPQSRFSRPHLVNGSDYIFKGKSTSDFLWLGTLALRLRKGFR